MFKTLVAGRLLLRHTVVQAYFFPHLDTEDRGEVSSVSYDLEREHVKGRAVAL